MEINQPHIVARVTSMPASRRVPRSGDRVGCGYSLQHRVDDYAIRNQVLADDPGGKRRRHHAVRGTGFAGPLLALGQLHEIPRQFDIQHLAEFATDHRGIAAAVTAYALLLRADNHPFHRVEIHRQSLTSGTLAFLWFSNRNTSRFSVIPGSPMPVMSQSREDE